MRGSLSVALWFCLGATAAQASGVQGTLVSVVKLNDAMPVGIAASVDGRIFLAYSRAIDEKEPISLAELKGRRPAAYPPTFKQGAGKPALDRLLSVQALTVDARNYLWILDTGRVGNHKVAPNSPKLVAVDLARDQVVKTIPFTPEVAGPKSFLNDVCIDLSKGKEGMAFITDSSFDGPNAIVVVDLASGKSVRRLNDHPSTKPVPGFVAVAEGKPLKSFKVGADGIALGADGHHLFYSPTSSHHWYRVSTDALVDAASDDNKVASTVEDLGDRGFASDGLLGDSAGRIYLTDYEHNAIKRRALNGGLETVIEGDELLWPDSMALASDGSLYFTVTQLERLPRFGNGQDLRTKPFIVYKVQTDSKPLMIGPRGAKKLGD